MHISLGRGVFFEGCVSFSDDYFNNSTDIYQHKISCTRYASHPIHMTLVVRTRNGEVFLHINIYMDGDLHGHLYSVFLLIRKSDFVYLYFLGDAYIVVLVFVGLWPFLILMNSR